MDARLRVTVDEKQDHHWTEDLSLTGMRMKIGKKLSLPDVTDGKSEVQMLIEVPGGDPLKVVGKPVWAVQSDDGELATGWVLSCHEGDAQDRLQDLVSSFE